MNKQGLIIGILRYVLPKQWDFLFPVEHEAALELKEQDAEVVRQHERM